MRSVTFLIALLMSSVAHADVIDFMQKCPHLSGGAYSEALPEQWKQRGYGLELAWLSFEVEGKEMHAWHYRQQLARPGWSAKLDIYWTPWEPITKSETDGGRVFLQIKNGVWEISKVDKDQLVGKYFLDPVNIDTKTLELKSEAPKGETPIRFACRPSTP